MLRCKEIDSGGPDRSFYTVVDEGAAASPEALARVVRAANVLIAENGLAGKFAVSGPGLVALELARGDRTFFHNGIVFAALDAVNDPVRNPTLTMMAAREDGELGKP
jgi:hypothetical protein